MADIGCPSNAAVAFDYLLSRGLRDFQAAGVIGNLQQESKLNPRAFAPSEGAYGIAQWRADRWTSLLGFASRSGRDPWSLALQLDFLWYELSSAPSLGLQSLLASTTVEGATVVFQDGFERCGNCATPERINYARAALFACPMVRPPSTVSKWGALAAALGVAALAVVGYSVYKAARPPEPLPPEPNPFLRPIYRGEL
jgi:hypothetical protein